ncbi:hypothetical protein CCR87_14910 [Rhodobaculum claviforme]|uniref:Uncharacterized protein n=1 Tax=Rhodobaculum claviforme TaxID=1549854 RepID=A0A934WK00_9RHOB|nr:hypothetical protein [Rhodobaculum claviforme]
MLPGTQSVFAPCHPAPSSTRTACAPSETVREIPARWAVIAAVSAWGMTSAAVVPRPGQTAPKMQAEV